MRYFPGLSPRIVNWPFWLVFAIRSNCNVRTAESSRLEYTPTTMPCAGSRLRASKTIPEICSESTVSPVEKLTASPSSSLPSFKSLTASEKSIVYVVLGTSVSRKLTVSFFPLAVICGIFIWAGETTTLVIASFT